MRTHHLSILAGLALCTSLVAVVGCGGGGGGGGGVSDVSAPAITFATGTTITTTRELTRSVSDGVTMRIAVTASDDVAVTGVSITLTAPGAAAATGAMTYDSVSGTWRAQTEPLVPPISGYDEYLWTATARDASGKSTSLSGSFKINGPTPPSTGGAF